MNVLRNLFHSLSSTRRRPVPRPRRRPQLELEALEARNLLTSFTPIQIRHAYGFDRVGFENSTHALIAGNGAGQTIGIVDAYDDPNIRNDLAAFDARYGLPAPPAFTVVNQAGGTTLPGPDPGDPTLSPPRPPRTWEQETALDVEYAHAMAPGANILLVEANDNDVNGATNLETAVKYAANHGATAVSMSYGAAEFATERNFDSTYTHAGTTYFASTGDSGAPGWYQAYSPNVVAVGGTSLFLNGGNYGEESGWSGSGGGISQFESQPGYQNGVVTQSTTRRTIPDVSFVADPNTGVIINDTFDGSGFYTIGGTSLSCPIMAGLSAVVNQGNAYLFDGFPSYSGTNFLNALYHLPQSDLNDVLTGNNGFPAGPGYDLVTGRGTPIVDRFVSAMFGAPVLNPLTGELLVTGGAHGSNDTITLSQSGSQTRVEIASSLTLPGAGIPSDQVFFYNAGQLSSITVSTSDGGTTVNVLNTAVTVNLADHGITVVNVGNARNTVNVWETDVGVGTTIHGGTGTIVNVGKNGSVQNIKGNVTVDNPSSVGEVNVDDSADFSFRTVTIDSFPFGGTGAFEFVSGLAPGTIFAKRDDVARMRVRTGPGGAAVNVLSTRFETDLFSSSVVTVNVGNGGSVAGILGALNLENESSSDFVNINDQNDATFHTANIGTTPRSGDTPLGFFKFGTFGIPITWDYNDTARVTINFGSGGVAVSLFGAGVPTTLNGNASVANSLAGPDADTTWNVTGANVGNLSSAVAAAAFTNFQFLSGGSGNDAFNFSNGASLGTFLIGSSLNGGGGFNTFNLGASTANLTVRVTGADAGNVPGVVGAFANVQNLITGSGNDAFVFSDGASLGGGINGGAGSNTLNEAAYTTRVTLNLAASSVTGAGTIANIQTFVGGSSSNILFGPNAATGWHIAGRNAGTLSGGVSASFTNFQNLIGESGSDAFVFADGAGVDGNISNIGGSGGSLDYSAYSTPVTVNLPANSATGVGGSVLNIHALRGGQGDDSLTGNSGTTTTFLAGPGNDTITGAGGINTLVGPNADSTWNVTAQNGGALVFAAGTTTFSGVQALTGGSGADAFVFADGTGIDGNLNGGLGANSLDYSAYSTPVTVILGTLSATGVGGNFVNVQSFVGSAAGGNSLNGPNAPTTWSVSGADAGTLTGGLSFSNFGNLTGGPAADSFVFADGASVSGSIDGGGGANALNYSAYSTTVTVDLQTSTATGVGGSVANIQNVTGGTGGGAGIYNILVGNGGNVLTGGDGRRNLLIAGGTASTLLGGNQDDILIGGTTAYDLEAGLTSLNAIMAYWSGTADDYATRVNNLLTGNGVPLLDATMVFNNGGGNTLTGNHGGPGELNLFYGLTRALETTDYDPTLGEIFINV